MIPRKSVKGLSPVLRVFACALFLMSLFSAPLLHAQTTRSIPRARGNYTDLQPQTAMNTVQFNRIPASADPVGSHPFIYFGPLSKDLADRRQVISRGAATHFGNKDAYWETDLPFNNRAKFFENIFTYADRIADSLPDGDPRKASIRKYAIKTPGGHECDGNYAAWMYYGEWLYKNIIGPESRLNGKAIGVQFITFDMEEEFGTGGNEDLALEFFAGVYEGALKAADAMGHASQILAYGTFTLSGNADYGQNASNGDAYFRLPTTFWRDGERVNFQKRCTEIARKWKRLSYVGRDQYARSTWDDSPVYDLTPEGAIKLNDEGRPIWRYGARITTIMRKPGVPLYPDEAREYINSWYSEWDHVLAGLRWWCNTPVNYKGDFVNMPYPNGTWDIRPGLENIRLCGTYRDDTESIGPLWDERTGKVAEVLNSPEYGTGVANNRPIHQDSVESTMVIRSMAYGGNLYWSNYGNKMNFNWGGDNGIIDRTPEGGAKGPLNQALGQVEYMLLARHRALEFPDYFKLYDSRKIEFVIPARPVVNGNKALGERETDKPLIFGFKERGGCKFWITCVWPSQNKNDAKHDRVVKMWLVGKDGKPTTKSYQFLLKDRKTVLEGFVLPKGSEYTPAENFRFQWTGLLGQTFTRSGKYTFPVQGTPVAPEPANTLR